MALIYNGTTIAGTYHIDYNGTDLDEVWVCDTSTSCCEKVWSKCRGVRLCFSSISGRLACDLNVVCAADNQWSDGTAYTSFTNCPIYFGCICGNGACGTYNPNNATEFKYNIPLGEGICSCSNVCIANFTDETICVQFNNGAYLGQFGSDAPTCHCHCQFGAHSDSIVVCIPAGCVCESVPIMVSMGNQSWCVAQARTASTEYPYGCLVVQSDFQSYTICNSDGLIFTGTPSSSAFNYYCCFDV